MFINGDLTKKEKEYINTLSPEEAKNFVNALRLATLQKEYKIATDPIFKMINHIYSVNAPTITLDESGKTQKKYNFNKEAEMALNMLHKRIEDKQALYKEKIASIPYQFKLLQKSNADPVGGNPFTCLTELKINDQERKYSD